MKHTPHVVVSTWGVCFVARLYAGEKLQFMPDGVFYIIF